eukprot:Opistho-1_new@22173
MHNDLGSAGDVRRHHHAHAIVEDRGLVRRRRRLPLHHRVGLDDRRFDCFGQFDRDRALFPKFENDVHAVLQEFMRFADDVLRDVDLFERVLVHEHQIVPLGIEELEILGVEADLFDRVGAAETVVELTPVDQILGFDLHIGAALARLGVLDLGDLPDPLFIFDNIAGTDFNAGDFHRAHSLDKDGKSKAAPAGHSYQVRAFSRASAEGQAAASGRGDDQPARAPIAGPDEHDKEDQPDPRRIGRIAVAGHRKRRVIVGHIDGAGVEHAQKTLADDHARRGQNAHAMRKAGVRTFRRPAVIEPATDRTDHDGQDDRHRQVDTDADRERREPQLARAAEQRVDDDEADPCEHAIAEHRPVKIAAEHALCERRDQPRLRCRQGLRPRTRNTDEADGLVEHIEYRRDNERTEDHADDQRDLLFPRRRAHELAGLEILEVIVRDRRDAEDKAGDDQRIGDHCGDFFLTTPAAKQAEQQQRRCDNRKDADPRHRRVRRTDQARHIAGDRRDHQPDDDDEQDRAGN